MTPTVLYVSIAAGVAVIGGVGYAIYEHFHSPCPTPAEFAAILAAIDSGTTGQPEALADATRFDAQGCVNEAAAIRKLVTAKYSGGTLGGLTVARAPAWPDTDPKCKAAIDALPKTARPNPTGGSPLPSFYEAARRNASDARASGDPKGLRNLADLLDSSAAEVGKTDMMAGSALTTAANCLRTYAESIVVTSGKVPAAPPAHKVTGRSASWLRVKPGQRVPPHLRRKLFV